MARCWPQAAKRHDLTGPQTTSYAIDAVLAVIARQQKGQVTVFTSDVDDLEKLVPDTIVVKKV
ncbi:hypothetical protein [Streptosporangium sp. H16]|uniref:hypothetical protein n=1 Tax=Streptosporangium sp. H16 TaxID=3444184 RepID=UPI003F7AB9CA